MARLDDPDLSQHERQILDHIPAQGTTLTSLAQHLGLPKSTTSVMVKRLAGRRFLKRPRDRADERRLVITLTAKGKDRVDKSTVLRLDALTESMKDLDPEERGLLLELVRRLVGANPVGLDTGPG